jgi:2-oxo-3-hexenedioate decarboxylase
MEQTTIIAGKLDEAARTATPISQFGDALDLDAAYSVQHELIALRTQRGERLIGLKMGLTSRAKMLQVGVSEMNFGQLTDGMLIEEGSECPRSRFIHPRAEPEIAFLLRKPLAGRISSLTAWDAVEAVAPAVEVIDSRYRDFRFTLTDVVADNSSSSALAIGPWCSRTVDVSNLGIALDVQFQPRQVGSSAAILGNPIRALVAAARLAEKYGATLSPGDIVMAGAATAAEHINAGEHVTAQFEALGKVSFLMR